MKPRTICEYKGCSSRIVEVEEVAGHPLTLCEDHGPQWGMKLNSITPAEMKPWALKHLKQSSAEKWVHYLTKQEIEEKLAANQPPILNMAKEHYPEAYADYMEQRDETTLLIPTMPDPFRGEKGRQVIGHKFFCPFCQRTHNHGADDGWRCSHCEFLDVSYYIVNVTEEQYRRFWLDLWPKKEPTRRKGYISPEWRYVLLIEVDRLYFRDLEPTILYIPEQVFPPGTSKQDALNTCSDIEVRWVQEIEGRKMYCCRLLARLNIAKRHKNVWDVHTLRLERKKNKIRCRIIYRHPLSVFLRETVAHVLNLEYWEGEKDVYPLAGIDKHYLTNHKPAR